MAKQMGTPVQYHNTVVQVLHVHVHKNISEPQVPSPRKASRPRSTSHSIRRMCFGQYLISPISSAAVTGSVGVACHVGNIRHSFRNLAQGWEGKSWILGGQHNLHPLYIILTTFPRGARLRLGGSTPPPPMKPWVYIHMYMYM